MPTYTFNENKCLVRNIKNVRNRQSFTLDRSLYNDYIDLYLSNYDSSEIAEYDFILYEV